MRVLAADDEEDVRLLLDVALGMDPAVALTLVSSGEEALAAVALEPFDVIVLDGMMPGLGGAATCRRLREDARTRDVPVVFLTALTSAADRRVLEEAGATAFITKPFDPFALVAELRACVPGL